LLSVAADSLRQMLYYIEVYASAYEPQVQRILADLGFRATGYITGWEVVNGQREDRIIFSWVRDLSHFWHLDLKDKNEIIYLLFII
jgi:RimJ/RimL family protein N-acetyltransferase